MPHTPLLRHLRASFLERPWAERLQLWFSAFLQLAILGVLVGALVEGQWLVAFTAAAVLGLTFTPALIERQLDVQLPVEFTLVNALFLYAAFGLGEVRQFYARYWWWDLMLHSFSAVVMGLVGFLLVYVFHRTQRIRTAPAYVALFAFCFAVTLGTLWELFEFLMDRGFGFNMQKSGLVDTMTDLMVNAAGGLLAAWMGHRYVSRGDPALAARLVQRLVERNPRLFGPRGAAVRERAAAPGVQRRPPP